jgi:hypothetical protein
MNIQYFYKLLAASQRDDERIKTFDTMFELSNYDARLEVMRDVDTLAKIPVIGINGAKVIYMALHELFNMPPTQQVQARIHGEWLASLRPQKEGNNV